MTMVETVFHKGDKKYEITIWEIKLIILERLCQITYTRYTSVPIVVQLNNFTSDVLKINNQFQQWSRGGKIPGGLEYNPAAMAMWM